MSGIRFSVLLLAVWSLTQWGSIPVSQGADEGQPNSTAAGVPGRLTPLDRHWALWLILKSQNEVALSKVASERSPNPEVQIFATKMVKDHLLFIMDLERLAGAAFEDRLALLEKEGVRKAGAASTEKRATPAEQTGASSSAGGASSLAESMAIIQLEIANQNAANARAELDGNDRRAFDDCYLGMQLCTQMKLIDTLKVLEHHVSPALRPVLAKGLNAAEAHLAQVKQVQADVRQLKGTADSNVSSPK